MIMLNLILSLIFMFLNHPMTMGLILLIQTIMISMITGTLANNFWFSYILFLIMVGGMLVLFIYMTSIAPNEIFNISSNLIIALLIITTFMIMLKFTFDEYFILINQMYSEKIWFNNSMNNNLTKYFNYPSMLIIFMMIIYLFITLIAVVKITKIEYGPLRQKF
uniref:NADH-ubiquinone oxidoreductase chain 6 n=1 Tax=Staphylinidae sp. BMNH 1274234 TaxID=1796566 RepID=A0A140EGA6_9COLE|nr:NADH dehydrogenase subunit 6 [Staphylinidae sp. BMNH 1274234]